jgi:hypothetical protein
VGVPVGIVKSSSFPSQFCSCSNRNGALGLDFNFMLQQFSYGQAFGNVKKSIIDIFEGDNKGMEGTSQLKLDQTIQFLEVFRG